MVPLKQKDRTPFRSTAKAKPPTIQVVAASVMAAEDQRRLESLIRLLIERRVHRLLKGDNP